MERETSEQRHLPVISLINVSFLSRPDYLPSNLPPSSHPWVHVRCWTWSWKLFFTSFSTATEGWCLTISHATSSEWVSVWNNQGFCKLIHTVAVSPLLEWWNALFENNLIWKRRRKKLHPLNSSISETHLISTICNTVQEAGSVLRREEVPQAFVPSVLNQHISWPCIGQKQKSYKVWHALFAFCSFFPVIYYMWAQRVCLRAEKTLYNCGQQ